MTFDISARLAQRLDQLTSPLAFVVSLHLFVEHLMNRLIVDGSPLSRGEISRIVEDRNYTFAIKLTLAVQMRAVPVTLYENIRALNRLRNAYAHEIDVDLPTALFGKGSKPFFRRDASVAFDVAKLRPRVEADLDEGLKVLHEIRGLTFGWLLEECRSRGIEAL